MSSIKRTDLIDLLEYTEDIPKALYYNFGARPKTKSDEDELFKLGQELAEKVEEIQDAIEEYERVTDKLMDLGFRNLNLNIFDASPFSDVTFYDFEEHICETIGDYFVNEFNKRCFFMKRGGQRSQNVRHVSLPQPRWSYDERRKRMETKRKRQEEQEERKRRKAELEEEARKKSKELDDIQRALQEY